MVLRAKEKIFSFMGWKFKDKIMGYPGKCAFLPTGHALRILFERSMLRRFPVHLASRYPLFHVKCRFGFTIIDLSFSRFRGDNG